MVSTNGTWWISVYTRTCGTITGTSMNFYTSRISTRVS
jgi:hypothetical protein